MGRKARMIRMMGVPSSLPRQDHPNRQGDLSLIFKDLTVVPPIRGTVHSEIVPKTAQDFPGQPQDGSKIASRWSQVGPGRPKTAQDGRRTAQDGPRRPQDDPRRPQDGPGRPQDSPTHHPRRSQDGPGPSQEPSKTPNMKPTWL